MNGLPAPDRWRLIAPLLREALDLPPERRGAFLDAACAENPRLRGEIDALLSADAEAASFLKRPADLPDPADEAIPSAAGSTIGPYRVVRELGRGGMGVVYEAEQQQPRRPVALKVILGGRHVDADTVRQFRRESESLARLKHPAIAAVYEAGSTDEGEHFFAMELVRGRPLSDHPDAAGPAERRDVRRRLALFRKICGAVAYAHRRGVIHRDLKPSNILVLDPEAPSPGGAAPGREEAGAPEVKVLDFGLARIIDPEGREETAVTAVGRIQGTLPFMSPEQVRGRRDEVDARSDVYALGVILYRLLSGRPPYDLDRADLPEAARIVCEEPPLPLRDAHGSRFDGDLEVIVGRALDKDPARRTQGVDALDDDLGRYLTGQPIQARPPSAAYQMRKLVARHKGAFAAAAAGLVLLVAFAVFTAVQARRIAAERDRANREATTAKSVADFMTGLFLESDPAFRSSSAPTVREVLDKAAGQVPERLAGQPLVQGRLMDVLGNVYQNLGEYEKARALLEDAVRTIEAAAGPDAAELDEPLLHLGVLDLNASDYPKATDRLTRVLSLRTREHGADDPSLADPLMSLAAVHVHEGSYRTAIGEADRAAVLLSKDPKADPMRVTQVLNIAAAAHNRLGETAEARATYERALSIQERALGPEHPALARTLNNLANTYTAAEAGERKRSLYERALAIQEKNAGPAHPSVAITLGNLAAVLRDTGHLPEARKDCERALAIVSERSGADSPQAAYQMSLLAGIELRAGEKDAAARRIDRALAILEARLEPDNPDIASALDTRGAVEAALGHLDRADEAYRRAAAIEEKRGLKHELSATLRSHADVLRRAGRPDEAVAAENRARELEAH